MKTSIITALVLTSSLTAFAAPAKSASDVQVWKGTGASYSPAGEELSQFQVEDENRFLEQNVVLNTAKITSPDGVKMIVQKITSSGKSFKVESESLGNGGGACYGGGICEAYVTDGKGKAFATTIVSDTEDERRYLTIELVDGKAVKMIRQHLNRVK